MKDELSDALEGRCLGSAGPSRQRTNHLARSTPIATPELKDVIESFRIRLQGGELIRQALGVEGEEQLADIPYKVPDVMRLIREFPGDRISFGSCKKNVDRIMNLFEAVCVGIVQPSNELENYFQMPNHTLCRQARPKNPRVSTVLVNARWIVHYGILSGSLPPTIVDTQPSWRVRRLFCFHKGLNEPKPSIPSYEVSTAICHVFWL